MRWTDRVVTRRSFGVLAMGGFVTALAACSTGNATDAQRGRERDARRTSVVDEMQQTQTASLVLSTPEATAEAD